MGECDGASKVLAESLQSQKNKKMSRYQKIRNLLNAEPPKFSPVEIKEENKTGQVSQGESIKNQRI